MKINVYRLFKYYSILRITLHRQRYFQKSMLPNILWPKSCIRAWSETYSRFYHVKKRQY